MPEQRDIQDCIHFMWEEWAEYTDYEITFVVENLTCLHPDREDTNGECEYLNSADCKFFEAE